MLCYIRPREFRFAASTAVAIGIKGKGYFVEFFQLDGENWFVAISKKETGYRVSDDANRGGMSISCTAVCRSILAKLDPGKDRIEAQLKETNFEYQGQPVWEIIKREVLGIKRR